MPDLRTRAQPPLEFIPQNLNPAVLRTVQLILPFWVRSQTNLAEMQAGNVETLAELYHRFQTGKTRFLLAFRHPSTNDPFCLGHLLWKLVPQAARQAGNPLKSPIHAHFIYDRGIPLWAGSAVEWLLPRMGCTPIQRGKLDLIGLRSARNLFANGNFPIAASPEGGTNGHNELVSPLEPGIAQLGFWCVEDLLKADRTEEVVILPVGIQYQYLNPPWQAIDALLTQMEQESGLQPTRQELGLDPSAVLYPRLYQLAAHLLTVMEEFYQTFYPWALEKTAEVKPEAEEKNSDPNTLLSIRLQQLLNAALQVAEQYFGIKGKGSVIDRCRRLEQASWDWIYRDDLKQPEAMSEVDRGLADLVAEETDLRIWHMRVVESFVAVTGKYVKEAPSAERFAETTILLWTMVARIKGKGINPRPTLGKQRAHMVVGQPISVSDRWQDYKSSRRKAVAALTQDLQTVLEELIITPTSTPTPS